MKLLILFFLPFTLFALEYDEYSFENGQRIYNQTCISCHGANGNSSTNMQLIVKPRDLTKSILNQEQIYLVIKNGSHKYGAKSDIMPSFDSVYKDDDLQDSALFIYEKFTKQKNSKRYITQAKQIKNISLSLGKKIFLKNCSLCHGVNGDVKSEFVEISKQTSKFIYPYDLRKIILNEEQIFLYAKYGGQYWGTNKNDMPSWQKKYDDKTLKSVAKYIHEIIKDK